MLSPRSWACTYTSDTHKKPKNARWVDGILEVSFFGATERFAKLYAADDDNKPVGAPVARRKLVDAEFDAVTEGDPLRGLEGFDVHPDEEIHETNRANQVNQEPYASIHGEANEDALETKTRRVPFAPRRRAFPGASAAALRPFRAPGATARATVSANAPTADARPPRDGSREKRRESLSESDLESDSGDSADARAALARFAGDGSGAFADLYAGRSAGVSAGKGPAPGTAAPGTAAPGTARVPFAARRSKYAAFDTKEAIPKNRFAREGVTETGVVSGLSALTAERPPGGVSDLAAALARAGPAGVAGLASLAASFGTASSAEGVAARARAPPTRWRAPPKTTLRETSAAAAMADASAAGTALRLAFPSSGSVETASAASDASDEPSASSFANAEAYRAHFCGALRAEMAETLRRARLDLERVTQGLAARGDVFGPSARNAPRMRTQSTKLGGDADREDAARVSRAFRSSASGAAYHADCAVRFETFANGTQKRGRDVAETAETAETAAAAKRKSEPTTRAFLYLNDPDERRGGVCAGGVQTRAGVPRYRKGDLWVLANTARFEMCSNAGSNVGDKTKAPFAAVARALWHGPDKDGKLEIALLCARPGALAGDRRAHRVYAMRARDVSRAIAEHDAFAGMTVTSFPLLPHVSGAPIVKDRVGGSPPAEERELGALEERRDSETFAAAVRAMRETRGLNRDQAFATAAALRAVVEAARRVPLRERTVSPVRLVHGPFGSGKTRALASFVIEAASRARAEGRGDFRVLLTAHTNVAVDRLLKALLDQGFDEFVRVGALRKMDPSVLSRSLHVAAASGPSRGGAGENEPVLGVGGRPLRGKGADHARELRAMLREAKTSRERAALARELRETQEGKADARARALGKCVVVATTAASCANECLRDSTFRLVVLDEASQITEPAFVAAVAAFGCETLVAVGDPKQLGPVVEKDTDDNEPSKLSKLSKLARSRSLFARLEAAGHAPTLLRAQYRCHPSLSAVANACFYGGALADGVAARDRAPLLRVSRGEDGTFPSTPMPPLVWVDVATSTGPSRDVAYDKNRSAFSAREARVAALVVDRLTRLGVDPGDVGVVTLFRAHADAVARAVAGVSETTRVSGAKSLREDGGRGAVVGEDANDAGVRTQVSTADAFQGQEKEVMVLSLCGGGGGPFATPERLCVALTRAKRHLVVLGDSKDKQATEAEAWRLCLRAARRAPCGFVDAGRVRSDAATRAWLAEWRRNGDDVDDIAKPGAREDTARKAEAEGVFSRREEAAEEAAQKTSSAARARDDDDDDDDDDEPDPFDPIVLSGDEDTLYVPAGSPLSRSPLAFRDEENEANEANEANARAETRSPRSARRRKPLLRLDSVVAVSPEDAGAFAARKRAKFDELRTSTNETNVHPNRTKKESEEANATNTTNTTAVRISQVRTSGVPSRSHESRESPDPELDTLPPARLAFHAALRTIAFSPEQYWRAYCDLHRAALYGDKSARARVECSRLGAVLATHFRLDLSVSKAWDARATREILTSAVVPGMATFTHATHGFQWTRLRNLIEAFDDAEALARDPAGFGAHVLEDARTQEKDEAGARAFADGGVSNG